MKKSILDSLEKNELTAQQLGFLLSCVSLSFFFLSYANATWVLMFTGARDVVIGAGLIPTAVILGITFLEIWLRAGRIPLLGLLKKLLTSDYEVMRSEWRKKLIQVTGWLVYALATSFAIWWLYDKKIPRHYNRDMGMNSNTLFYIIALMMQTLLINVVPTLVVNYNIKRVSNVFDYVRKNEQLIKDILIFSVAVVEFGIMHSYISMPVAWGSAIILGIPKWWMYRQQRCVVQVSLYHGVISAVGFSIHVL